ncbi:MAG: right-handed parallel beta-helix repeat-containing protein [Verrucomicrobiales bacterium]
MNKHFKNFWNPSTKQPSAGRQKQASFFLWVRDRAFKQLDKRGGFAIATAAALSPLSAHAAEFTVDTLSDTDSDGATLREAIVAANATAEADTIRFSPELSGTLTLTQGELVIDSDISIVGPDERLTISGGSQSSIFEISSATTEISNLILTAGNGNDAGAIFAEDASLTLSNCEVSESFSSGRGGGITANHSVLTLTECTIVNNEATTEGGGISTIQTQLTLTASSLTGNNSATQGGGIYSEGVFYDGSFLTMNDCVVASNSVNAASSVTTTGGGGIETESLDTVTIEDTIFSNNIAASANDYRGIGGAISSDRTGDLILTNCGFYQNEATFVAGAVASQYSLTILVSNCTVAENESKVAGGFSFYGCTNVDLVNTTVIGNRASISAGGGIYSRSSDQIHIDNCTVTGNSSVRTGAGIYIASSELEIANTISAFNQSDSGDPDLALANSRAYLSLAGPNLFNTIDQNLLDDDQILAADPTNVFAETSTTNGIVTGTLADNGGPISTLRLLQGGVAIDAGFDTSLATDVMDLDGDGDVEEDLPIDARGLPRISGTMVDLGAFEFVSSYDAPANELMLTLDATESGGDTTLSFDVDRPIPLGESWIITRSTDLETFTSIFTFDGETVTSEEADNLSAFDSQESSVTITDTASPQPKAFYRLEIAPES